MFEGLGKTIEPRPNFPVNEGKKVENSARVKSQSPKNTQSVIYSVSSLTSFVKYISFKQAETEN